MGWALPTLRRDRPVCDQRAEADLQLSSLRHRRRPISMVEHITGSCFIEAVKFITGETPANTGEDFHYHRDDWKGEAAVAPHDFVTGRIEAIVRELVPVRSSPGGLWLREVRAIDTESIADILERTDAIGWHPSLLFREQGHPLDRKHLGCIVGLMTDPVTAKPTGAISRTYIHEGRKTGKAKTLGRPVGIVRLSADEDVLVGLHLAEGLETALAAMAKGFRPVWSTGSAGLMAAFPSSSASRRWRSSPTTILVGQACGPRTKLPRAGARLDGGHTSTCGRP